MITINLGSLEYYDSTENQFIYEDGGTVRFEYSLKVIYDWESKWKKPFLKGGLTERELVDLYMLMALDPIDEKFLTEEVMEMLSNYIADPHTATTFTSLDDGQNGNTQSNNGKLYTAEELYAIMLTNNIPLEFENRNLNRLLVILKIISSYNEPPKKMSKQDIFKQNAELNRKRRAELKSKG